MNSVNVLTKIAAKAPKLAPKLGRIGLKLQKASPEILFGVGVAAVLGGVVLACKSTLKIDSILDEHQSQLDNIKSAVAWEEMEYTQEDAIKDKTQVYFQTGIKLFKSYLPAATTLGLGIACFVGSHNIQHQRIVGLAAAYKTVESGFKNYRARVVDEMGVEKDKDLYFGTKSEKMSVVEVDEETGKEKKSKKDVKIVNLPDGVSEYARYFDSQTSSQWHSNFDYNLDFLKMTQNYMNDRLHLIGHVFLNEVYDDLGMERTKAGAVVGWIDGGDGDNFIDFGITDYMYNGRMGSDYVNGRNESLLLDFNVDGVIWDKI